MKYGLSQLVDDWGYRSTMDMLNDAVIEGCVPSICVECGYTTEMEPDQDAGWCEDCRQNTVKSCFVLAGVI